VVAGTEAVARQALTYARFVSMEWALVNGAVGLVGTRDGRSFSAGWCTVRDGKIVEIDILADPARLRQLDVTGLEG
jgi:RNA polymerase sigma-70 factor (ECF subfamily)